LSEATPGSDRRLEDALEELEAARFIAEASAALAQVADYESTLERIASLAVPRFADWFGVLIRDTGGNLRRAAVRHLDPAMVRAVEEIYRRYPPGEEPRYGAPLVLATGKPLWAPDVEALVSMARDPEHEAMLRSLGLKSFICVPMRSRDRVCGALTFATAESGRRYGEIHLRAAEDLAARCAIAIENAQLLEKLQEADRRKDEFIAILAHELRNPLAPMRNAVEIVRASAGAIAEARWANEVIERQLGHLSRLVDDLLDVSRISHGSIELRRERVSLASVVEAAVESSRPAIERARHELSVILPQETIDLEADSVRLSQVLSNLLNNAARYTHARGHVTVRASREGGMAVVRVIDDGVGIPPQMLDRIFEMFVQVPGAGGPRHGGLGIGLTLVKRLVELHGGKIDARSDGPQLGMEMVVRLPAADELTEPVRTPAPVVVPRAGALRILAVDDNVDLAISLASVLGMWGHTVRTAHDGSAALEVASVFSPEVVLLDLGLPELDGLEVARRLCLKGRPVALLVSMSGFGQEQTRHRSDEAGFHHHLVKPVDLDRLRGLLEDWARTGDRAATPAALLPSG
jgi:signal transduction histidine kinase/ActR/RegA family two-component response regulator